VPVGRSAGPGSIPPALKEAPAAPPAATPTLETAAPSVTGIDRGHWARTRILVPVDGIVHHPTYARHVIVADRTARQQRRYPTAEKALELWGGSESDQQAEAALNHLRAVADLVLQPLRAVFIQHPWEERLSPAIAYERYPAGIGGEPRPEPEAPAAAPRFGPPAPHRVTP